MSEIQILKREIKDLNTLKYYFNKLIKEKIMSLNRKEKKLFENNDKNEDEEDEELCNIYLENEARREAEMEAEIEAIIENETQIEIDDYSYLKNKYNTIYLELKELKRDLWDLKGLKFRTKTDLYYENKNLKKEIEYLKNKL